MNDPITFADLGLDEPYLAAVTRRGFTAPTDVQAATFAPGREGRDLVVQSCTGSGKTLAFGLPIFHRLQEENHPQVLILAPTRELAQQVATELRTLRRVELALLVGGLSYVPQLKALDKGAPIVVGTPGRVMDHLERGSLDLSRITMIVLDECDEMLNMGFLEDVETILKKVPQGPQTYLFSATLPSPIAHLAERFLKDPVRIRLTNASEAGRHVDIAHTPVMAPDPLQVRALVNLVLHDEPSSALIFTKTKVQTESVAEELTLAGLPAAFLHGDLAQATRARILEQFKKGQLRFLVATDVAARGLDITGLPLVVHMGIPTQMESYIHRSGRTGRAGAKGTSLALVNAREAKILEMWSHRGGLTLQWRAVPKAALINEARQARLVDRLREGATDANRAEALKLLETLDPETLAAGLLGLVHREEPTAYDLDLTPWVPRTWKDRPFSKDAPGKKPWSKPPSSWSNTPGEGGKPYEKKPYEKKPYEKKPYEKKHYEKKPFEKKSFDKKPWSTDPAGKPKKSKP